MEDRDEFKARFPHVSRDTSVVLAFSGGGARAAAFSYGVLMLTNKRYCYPLTITDFPSPYLISCEALATTPRVYAITVFERIQPGNPQQNGRHERMHLTLKKENTQPAAKNFLQQQARFDQFIEYFNRDRPHQAIGMKYPGEIYQPSPRPCGGKLCWGAVADAAVRA